MTSTVAQQAAGGDQGKNTALERFRALQRGGAPPTPTRPETWRTGSLDPDQKAAVHAPEGPVVLLGGPGTGKTYTMRERAQDLVKRGASPETVAILSYSGYTAGVLRREINDAVGGECQALGFFVGTFHRLCSQLLRRHGAAAAGIKPNFTIWDEENARQALSVMLNGQGNRPGYIAETTPEGEPPAKMTDGEIERLWRWHNHNRAHSYSRQREPRDDRWPEFASLYQREKITQNAVDFNDLIHLALAALENDNVRQRYRRGRTRHLLIDEFQDLGHFEYELIRMLTGPTSSVTIVCDPNQSIYSWRGADSDLIERFMLDYSDAAVHMLSVNHRSAANIVQLTQAFNRSPEFSGLTQDYQRAIRPPGENIRILNTARTPSDQYVDVVHEIKRLIEAGYDYADIGVIYRSGRSGHRLAAKLRANRVPYYIQNAPPPRRSDTVTAAIAMLELVVNPWNSMALSLAGNIDPERSASKQLNAQVSNHVREEAEREGINLVTAAAVVMERYAEGTPAHRQLKHIVDTYDELEAALTSRDPEQSTPDALLTLAYHALVRSATPGSVGESDLSHDQARALARRYHDDCTKVRQNTPPRTMLSGYIELLSESRNQLYGDPSDHPETGIARGVTLSTIHASKGRQFKIVFFIDVNESVIPGAHVREESPAIYEEQRLFYVGISRGLNLLYLCYSLEDDAGKYSPPSRFMNVLTTPGEERSAVESADADPPREDFDLEQRATPEFDEA